MANYDTRSANTVWILIGAGVLCAALIALTIFLTLKNQKNAPAPTADDSLMAHTTLDVGSSWSPNYSNLQTVMTALKLPPEGAILHHHVHLDMFIDGNPVSVPAQIGLSQSGAAPLHTHDDSGIIHVESASTTFAPVLGEVFDIWGVSLTSTNVGGYKVENDKKLSLYVNGQAYTGDPRKLPLNQHDEIYLFYGTDTQLPSAIPSSYTFPEGL
jgi:hypothetical protein